MRVRGEAGNINIFMKLAANIWLLSLDLPSTCQIFSRIRRRKLMSPRPSRALKLTPQAFKSSIRSIVAGYKSFPYCCQGVSLRSRPLFQITDSLVLKLAKGRTEP